MSDNQYIVKASTSRCKKQMFELRPSTSNHNPRQEDINQRRRKADIKQLERRLRVLEEEVEMLKVALLESVRERTKLVNEIRRRFEIINRCLLERKLQRGELYVHGRLEERRAGLLEVLGQESNPTLVNRDLRADALGYDQCHLLPKF